MHLYINRRRFGSIMWFIFSIFTAISWGAANLFYKKGSDTEDKSSHLKIVTMVGFMMGLHAFSYLFIKDITFDPFDMIRYLPVSAMYILSMTFGYIGLRYIELSIAAPVQNSSGAVSAILLFIFFPREMHPLDILGIVVVTLGVIGLAMLEKKEEEQALKAKNEVIDKKYQIGVLAITFPILYSLIDGLGTFADGIYLDELKLLSEDSALLAYEFTFLICAILSYLYITVIKKKKFIIFKEHDKGYAAILETTGQFFYEIGRAHV